MNIVGRISYEKISDIFDELSEKVISSGDVKQYPEMWKKFEEILLSHGWTFDEWESELNKRPKNRGIELSLLMYSLLNQTFQDYDIIIYNDYTS